LPLFFFVIFSAAMFSRFLRSGAKARALQQRWINTAALSKSLSSSNPPLLVDVRPIAAFNGWRLGDEVRGGHLPGAVTFPLSWLEGVEDSHLQTVLAQKSITPNQKIVTYGYTQNDAQQLAEKLKSLGFTDVDTYDDGQPDWASDPARPLKTMPRFQKLVHADWVRKVLAGQPVEHGPSRAAKPQVFHVHYQKVEDYWNGHIPGAPHLDTMYLEEPKNWNRRSPKELEAALLHHGITKDTTVILYGRTADPQPWQPKPGQQAGQIAATRAALILMYAGVKDVRLLDAGLGAWERAGFQVTRDPYFPTSGVKSFGATIPEQPQLIADLEEAKQIIADKKGGALVSIRSWKEWIGETSGYNYIAAKGDIPGAIFGNCGSSAYHMQTYRNPDNTMRPFYEIEEMWKGIGITGDKRVAFYCGTGWRASETFLYAYYLGWDKMAVYDGGWYEWSTLNPQPYRTGPPVEEANDTKPRFGYSEEIPKSERWMRIVNKEEVEKAKQ
jgi:thiosulfate/3-mercaptopyruvate sulfurtransferase